jgi:hypothetical protein
MQIDIMKDSGHLDDELDALNLTEYGRNKIRGGEYYLCCQDFLHWAFIKLDELKNKKHRKPRTR